ncbi:hypothetical protein HMPREF1575_00632 [Gardnerella vaginalis JCP7672]|nr:hypothetical protein HMPREF1575_00632 [Gardnerella vaginalis JCP7672]
MLLITKKYSSTHIKCHQTIIFTILKEHSTVFSEKSQHKSRFIMLNYAKFVLTTYINNLS